MISFFLNKTAHDSAAHFSILDARGGVIGEASFPLGPLWTGEAALAVGRTSLSLRPAHALPLQATKRFAPMTVVYADGSPAGNIQHFPQKWHLRPPFFRAYTLWLDGTEYRAYPVGFGEQGRYLCVYRRTGGPEADAEVLAAQAEMPVHFQNWLRSYSVSASDDHAALACTVYLLYLEYVFESHRMEVPKGPCTETMMETTRDKWLLGKYDPSFG